MQRNALRNRGSPSSMSRQEPVGGTAKDIDHGNNNKPIRIPGDLLARTIAARPPNEDRIRGMVA